MNQCSFHTVPFTYFERKGRVFTLTYVIGFLPDPITTKRVRAPRKVAGIRGAPPCPCPFFIYGTFSRPMSLRLGWNYPICSLNAAAASCSKRSGRTLTLISCLAVEAVRNFHSVGRSQFHCFFIPCISLFLLMECRDCGKQFEVQ